MSPKRIFPAAVPILANVCAWEGCRESFRSDEMPEGWRSMQLFWAPLPVTNLMQLMRQPNIWDRDCCLCPQHARLLESYLKDIGNRLRKTEE
jgi:hypothetical protein